MSEKKILQYRPRQQVQNGQACQDEMQHAIDASTQLTNEVIASLRRVMRLDSEGEKSWIGKPEDRNII